MATHASRDTTTGKVNETTIEQFLIENYDGSVDELGYLKHQMEAQNQRVERLQEEMIHVLRRLGEINTLSDNKNDHSVERQESSETNHQTSKETS